MTPRAISLLFALLLAARADTLILKDGTRVTGRWWSADAGQIHFLVDDQLQHYARSDVSSVTFGSQAVAPAPPPPAQAQPQEIGTVYFRNVSGELMPLERDQATERNSGAASYWEMPSARSRVRLKTAPDLLFVVRLANGIDPATLSLCPLAMASGNRRTKPGPSQPDPGRKNAPLTLPFSIAKVGESTYNLTVKDLAPGEYAFSPEGSNDAYCFGIDGAAPEQ